MSVGRPSKYKPEYCKEVLEWFREGQSISEICLNLDICRDTFYLWMEKHEEFSDTVKRGLELSKGWWEKIGREGASGTRDTNPTLWFMNMKNRFGHEKPSENIQWKDKQEVDNTHKIEGPVLLWGSKPTE